MSNFTPGPWRLHAGSIISPEYDDMPDGYSIAVIEDDGGYEAPIEQRPANARLIASAPDLYEALKLALEIIEGCDPDTRRKVEPTLKAALKKAEGV